MLIILVEILKIWQQLSSLLVCEGFVLVSYNHLDLCTIGFLNPTLSLGSLTLRLNKLIHHKHSCYDCTNETKEG